MAAYFLGDLLKRMAFLRRLLANCSFRSAFHLVRTFFLMPIFVVFASKCAKNKGIWVICQGIALTPINHLRTKFLKVFQALFGQMGFLPQAVN